ncbi:MAG: ABC transporter ATP-binding protein [Polyangiales bacterium]
MTESAQPLVEVRSLTKSFEHGGQTLEVLRGVDLSIQRGEMLTLVGPSGAGKSTLLHLLGALDQATSGDIRYAGESITSLSARALADFRNRSIGFVFQFHHLLPEFTALENVMMPALIAGHKDVQSRAKELLDRVGLTHRLTHRPGELSGGEQQRVALARALFNEPKLVLADEPTGNLDSKTSASIESLFFELNETLGTTMLIVTHSREFASRMPRVVSMRDGIIIEDATNRAQAR